MLEPLKLHVREEMRIGVVQVNDETDGKKVGAEMVRKGSASRLRSERPTHRVQHVAWPVLVGLNLPELLHSKSEFGRVATFVQSEAPNQLLRDRTTRPFGDNDVFSEDLDTGLVARAGLAVFRETELPRNHTLQGAVGSEHRLGCRESRQHFGAERLRLLREPTADISERCDVTALVAHKRWHECIRDPECAGRTQHQEAVALDGSVQGGPALPPIRNQGVQTHGIDNRAGQDMCADFGALLQNTNGNVIAAELLQTDGSGQSGRTTANHYDVVF